MTRTIAVAGGGTGGHVYPVLAVVEALRSLDPDLKFVYFGQVGGREHELVNKTGLPFLGIHAEKLRRYWDLRTFAAPFIVLRGITESLQLLTKIKPSALFVKGGYVVFPVALAAWLLGIPVVVHETDSIMGLANRLIAPLARWVAISFPRPLPAKPDKFIYTGHPVLSRFYDVAGRPAPKRTRPELLVTGGSQGAQSFNTLVAAALPELVRRYHVTHITGPADFSRMRHLFEHRHYEPMAYTDEMPDLLARADLVISRAGGTIFELAALGKPAILIPLPTASNDHQRANASILAQRDAAVMLDQTTATPGELVTLVTELMRDSKRRHQLETHIQALAKPDAAKRIAELVLQVARR